MSYFLVYSKAILVSCSATFGVCWCVIGFQEALYAVLVSMVSLLVLAAVLSAAVTLMFIFFDWKNRNEDSDPA